MIVHARQTVDGLRFRLWSSVSDGYCCEPMTREAFTKWMLELALEEQTRELAERLDRAARTGTSSRLIETVELDGEWEVGRCEVCESFHHAFEKQSDGTCRSCGNPRSDRAHRKPCR
jgi:hypothetical protein